MQNRLKNNFLIKIALALVAVFCFIQLISMQFEYNELRAEKSQIEADIAKNKEILFRLQNDLSKPFDDNYVIRVAREKLNMRLCEEIVFYSDVVK